MLLNLGDQVHVVFRRLFEGDVRRHFVGQVQEATDSAARVEGYVFVFDTGRQSFVRRPERRVRIIALTDGSLVINIIPRDVRVEDLSYGMSEEKHLVVTDGKSFSLDINEFGVMR